MFLYNNSDDPSVPKQRATLILVDRVDDLASVLTHSMSYAGLLHDLLEHEPYTVCNARGLIHIVSERVTDRFFTLLLTAAVPTQEVCER